MSQSITLSVKGLSHVPSFKNKKRIFGKRLVTKPEVKQWMDRCIRDLSFQLHSICQTTEGGTSMEQLRRFLTASCPADDCWQVIPELHISVGKVKRGEEGAVIEITPL